MYQYNDADAFASLMDSHREPSTPVVLKVFRRNEVYNQLHPAAVYTYPGYRVVEVTEVSNSPPEQAETTMESTYAPSSSGSVTYGPPL